MLSNAWPFKKMRVPLWKVTFSQEYPGPKREDAVHVISAGFSFFSVDPEQLKEKIVLNLFPNSVSLHL